MTRDCFQYAAHGGGGWEGGGDLGPLHVNVLNTIVESVMCKAHIGDAYCIAATSAIYGCSYLHCLSDDQAWFWVASQTSIGPMKQVPHYQ